MNTVIPDEFKKTADNGEFLYFLDWVDNAKTECMAIFLSDWGADILKRSRMWFCDGTFSVTPDPFKQVYIIMTQTEGHSSEHIKGVRCGFALLPNKKKETYELLFNTLKNRIQPTNLEHIMTDFEQSLFSVIKQTFPSAAHKGCRFHYNNAVMRQVGERGLKSLFNESAKFQELIYILYALVYFPPKDVLSFYKDELLPYIIDGIEHEESWAEYEEELECFGIYYEKTWIEARGGRAPLFPIATWNHYKCVKNEQHTSQTNNIVESYNRTMNGLISKNPNIWTVAQIFVQQEASARRDFFQHTAGNNLNGNTGRKQRSLNAAGRIKFLVDGYTGQMSKMDYARSIANEIMNS